MRGGIMNGERRKAGDAGRGRLLVEAVRGAPRGRGSRSVQALALGDVAGGAARLALHGSRGLALALLGRLLVVLALAGFGQDTGLLAGALEAAQGHLARLVFADFDAGHGISGIGFRRSFARRAAYDSPASPPVASPCPARGGDLRPLRLHSNAHARPWNRNLLR